MNFNHYNNSHFKFTIFVYATLVVTLQFIWQGNIGINLGDEGFLWYGAQRVLMGEVPIRDFMAYDPGRYYWSAIVMNILDSNGVITLRIAAAIFQAIGLFVGLCLVAQSSSTSNKLNFLYLILASIVFIIWMHPRHKLFDISLSIFLVGLLTFLLSNPNLKRFFFTGVGIGLIAVFGRNHGVYGVVSFFGILAWVYINANKSFDLVYSLAIWAVGVLIGFTPTLSMLWLVPGFAQAFFESIKFLFEMKTTNLALPIPWPWHAMLSIAEFGEYLRSLLIGLLYIFIPTFGIIAVVWVYWKKYRNITVAPAFVASTMLILPYTHFAYSRADIPHLAQGAFPFLLSCLILLNQKNQIFKWPLLAGLLFCSFWIMHIQHPGMQCRFNSECVTIDILDDNLLIKQSTAGNIELIREYINKYAPNEQGFMVTPIWPGAYALLEHRSPVWEIYALFPRFENFQLQEIDRLKTSKPGFILIADIPIDGRDDLRYRNTHPLVYQYITDNYELLPESKESGFMFFKAQQNEKNRYPPI